MMSFADAVKICLIKKYATMSGRASRAEYWWFQLFIWTTSACIISIISALGKKAEDIGVIVFLIFFIITLVPNTCVFVRRLHDRGHSSSFLLLAIVISIFGVILIGNIINLFGSEEGDNEYGPNPNKPIKKEDSNKENSNTKILSPEESNIEVIDVNL